jgi:alpha-mannosidase
LKPLRTRVGQRLQGKYPLKCVVLFMALALVFFPVHVRAQSDAENVVKSLSARVQNIVKRLQALDSLPAELWRYHAGDVPHGEAVDLDDSGWQLVKGPTGAPNEAIWYRRWIEVPKTFDGYDLTGSRIWFQFQADANGPMPEIVYFNGRRVALGEDLEPIILFDQAKPGEKVLVAVKLLHTADKKNFGGADLRVEFTSGRPNPTDLVGEIVSIAGLAPTLVATSPPLLQELEAAAGAVDLKALGRADQQAFDVSLQNAHTALEPLKPKLQQTSVRLTGNSHIDAAWLWPWTETVDSVRRTFSTALQLMYEYPQYTYTQSAAAYSEWIVEKYPSEYQEILDRVKQGRWEMVGGMWVEPDLNMPDGESLVRQLLVGKRYFKEQFGVDVRVGWNPDSFGYSWQLPQIYKKSGIDYFVTTKMEWNETNKLPLKVFWWQSPDGSCVLTYFPHTSDNGIDAVSITAGLDQARALNPGLPEMMHVFGVGDHGGGPTRTMLDGGRRWTDQKKVFPSTFFGLAQGFFSNLEEKVDTEHSPVWNYKDLAAGRAQLPVPVEGKFSLPVWNDELYLEYHRGVFTSQANHKRNMRESEEWMLDAEKYSSLAWLSGESYPSTRLNEAWKKVLFNQFHDLAAGSGIGVIYKDSQRDYDEVHWTADEATSKALHFLASEINTKVASGVPIMLVNPLAWERTDLAEVDVQLPDRSKGGVSVLDTKGRSLPVQMLSSDSTRDMYHLLVEVKNVPSLGYEVLQVVPGYRPFVTDLKAGGLTMENAALRVSVDPRTGCITSLYDKRAKFESIAAGGCGNELVAFKDSPKDFDAWNIDASFENEFTKLDKPDSVELAEKGPLRAKIRVTRTWQKSTIQQDIVLYAGLDRVDVVNNIDWQETHVLLKAVFPLASSSDMATFEIPYGSINRPTTRNDSWEAARFEVPALRWADLGDGNHGFSLINESKYGYDAKGNLLRISLLRAPTWPDPHADRGLHHFSYSLYPHDWDWKQALTVRHAYEFNYKLKAMQEETHNGKMPLEHSFVSVREKNVALTALKKLEDGDGILLRFYEWAGKDGEVVVSVPDGAKSAILTNLMEKPDGSTLRLSANQISVPVHPFEIVSIRVDYQQAAQQTHSQ